MFKAAIIESCNNRKCKLSHCTDDKRLASDNDTRLIVNQPVNYCQLVVVVGLDSLKYKLTTTFLRKSLTFEVGEK